MKHDRRRQPDNPRAPSSNGHNGKPGRSKWLLVFIGLGMVFGARVGLRRLRPGGSLEPTPALAPAGLPRQPVSAPWQPIFGHEKKDADAMWIFRVVVCLIISGLVIQWILSGFQNQLKHKPPPTDAWEPAQRPSRAVASKPDFPRLQVSAPLDWQAFITRQESELNSYGWVNRTSGIVRVPIERAMDLVLQEGLPTRSGTNGDHVDSSPYQLILKRPEHREPEIKGEK